MRISGGPVRTSMRATRRPVSCSDIKLMTRSWGSGRWGCGTLHLASLTGFISKVLEYGIIQFLSISV